MAGGIAIDRTDDIHPSVIEIAIKTVNAIPGLSWAGIDFMSTNLFEQQSKDSYCIIEVGSMPEFDMHEVPMQGKSRPVAKEFLKLMFPEIK
jgi:cyanophycin synthetase